MIIRLDTCQVHVLDLATMAWFTPEVSGTPPAPRTGHAAVCLDGVRVLIHGGWDFALSGEPSSEGYIYRDGSVEINPSRSTQMKPGASRTGSAK